MRLIQMYMNPVSIVNLDCFWRKVQHYEPLTIFEHQLRSLSMPCLRIPVRVSIKGVDYDA